MRWNMAGAALLIALVFTGREAPAQASRVIYDLATGAIERDRIVAGRDHRLVVRGLNSLCYTHAVRVTTKKAQFDAKGAEKVLGGGAKDMTPEPAPAPPPPKPEPAPVIPPETPRDSIRSAAVAAELANRAEWELNSVDETLGDAQALVSTFQKSEACEDPAMSQHALNHWASHVDDLRDNMRMVARRLAGARELLDRARTTSPDAKLAVRLDSLVAAAAALRKKAHDIRPEFNRASREIARAAQSDSIASQFWTSADDEQVDIVVVQRARRDGTTKETAISVPTERRHRFQVSTGIVGSWVGSPHYDRVSRPMPITSAPDSAKSADSTYATWARVSGNGIDVVNPALLVSVSLNSGAFGLNASAGTTLRAVNGGAAALEPLLGLGLGMLDRLFLQAGAHLGRRERLLFQMPDETGETPAARAIPQNLTRGDVVGVEWVVRPFLGFSLKLD